MPASSRSSAGRARAGARMEQPRLLTLVQLLEGDGELRQRVQHSLGQMLAELDFLSLFAETGLPSVHSFTTEIVQRLAAKVVPSAREDSDARKLLIDLYSSERYARQFAALSPELFERIVNVLTPATRRSSGSARSAIWTKPCGCCQRGSAAWVCSRKCGSARLRQGSPARPSTSWYKRQKSWLRPVLRSPLRLRSRPGSKSWPVAEARWKWFTSTWSRPASASSWSST